MIQASLWWVLGLTYGAELLFGIVGCDLETIADSPGIEDGRLGREPGADALTMLLHSQASVRLFFVANVQSAEPVEERYIGCNAKASSGVWVAVAAAVVYHLTATAPALPDKLPKRK